MLTSGIAMARGCLVLARVRWRWAKAATDGGVLIHTEST